ncbi:hypothetical protein [uncultured Polaribacter sp.]|uniref:hypothetical protein n=1 Tax=uncultured Polaribacter sp. TaxID=174711 RepID=UPI0026106F43|nr:hypothetical protein [uncultured Polaribacter sp.]
MFKKTKLTDEKQTFMKVRKLQTCQMKIKFAVIFFPIDYINKSKPTTTKDYDQ